MVVGEEQYHQCSDLFYLIFHINIRGITKSVSFVLILVILLLDIRTCFTIGHFCHNLLFTFSLLVFFIVYDTCNHLLQKRYKNNHLFVISSLSPTNTLYCLSRCFLSFSINCIRSQLQNILIIHNLTLQSHLALKAAILNRNSPFRKDAQKLPFSSRFLVVFKLNL
jgi:hypothetical protein